MKDYRRNNVIWYIICALIGGGCIIGGTAANNDFLIYFGVAFCFVIILKLALLLYRTRSEEEKYEYNMSMKDERTVYIAKTARSNAFYFSILAEVVLILGLALCDNPAYQIVCYLLCGQAVIYLAFYYYYRSKN